MKRSEIPKYLQGKVARKPKHFLLQDIDGDMTHAITVFKDFVSIRPLPAKHLIIVGQPDTSVEPDKDYETDLYVADHATILVRGNHKKDLEICVSHDEFPTKLVLDEREGKFIRR